MARKTYQCPCCEKRQPAKHFSCASGATGGKAKGPRKARSPELARAAAHARWIKTWRKQLGDALELQAAAKNHKDSEMAALAADRIKTLRTKLEGKQ